MSDMHNLKNSQFRNTCRNTIKNQYIFQQLVYFPFDLISASILFQQLEYMLLIKFEHFSEKNSFFVRTKDFLLTLFFFFRFLVNSQSRPRHFLSGSYQVIVEANQKSPLLLLSNNQTTFLKYVLHYCPIERFYFQANLFQFDNFLRSQCRNPNLIYLQLKQKPNLHHSQQFSKHGFPILREIVLRAQNILGIFLILQ
ncbi:hypothetical protein ABPG72_016400 [Tetrahymena utriculariae]